MLCILEKTPTSFGREKNDVRPQSMSMVADHCFFDGSGAKRSIKGGKGAALAEAMERIQSLQDKVEALMSENEKVKKANKRLVMQRRVALAVAMEAAKGSYPDTGMEAMKAEKAGKPPPKPSAREASTKKKGSSACVVS